MESNLEAYRLRKRRRQIFERIKKRFLGMIPFRQLENEEKPVDSAITIVEEESISETSEDNSIDIFAKEAEECEHQRELLVAESKCLKYTLRVVFFLFWVTCYVIAIELKFGIVYLLFSAIFGIYFNTRTTPKQKGEISAYSVFNKNCKSIDGTLKAEQFEQEIRFGSMSVR